MEFIVSVREVHVSHREVQAKTAEDAMDKVQDGDGEEVFMEYSHMLDSDTWTVEKKKAEPWVEKFKKDVRGKGDAGDQLFSIMALLFSLGAFAMFLSFLIKESYSP